MRRNISYNFLDFFLSKLLQWIAQKSWYFKNFANIFKDWCIRVTLELDWASILIIGRIELLCNFFFYLFFCLFLLMSVVNFTICAKKILLLYDHIEKIYISAMRYVSHYLTICFCTSISYLQCSVANRPKILPNDSKQPEFKTSGPRKIWVEFLAESLIFPNIGRKQPELSKLTESVKLS